MRVETQTPASGYAQPQKPTCEKCGRREGAFFSFHYGKKKSRTTQRDGRRYTYTTNYIVAGKKDAAACKKCIRWRRVLESISPLLGIAVCALVWWWVFFQDGLAEMFVGKPEKNTGMKWIVTALACMGIFLMLHELYSRLFANKTGPGERLVIALKRGELRRQGFDSFWDTTSFEKLR